MAIKIGISTIRTVLQNGFSIKKDDSQKSKNVDPKKLCKKINPKNSNGSLYDFNDYVCVQNRHSGNGRPGTYFECSQ